MKDDALPSGIYRGIAWLLLFGAAAVSVLTYWQTANMVHREQSATLELRATEAKNLLEVQVSRYTEALRGLQARFVVEPDLSLRGFRQYTIALDIESRLAGVQAIAFVRHVKKDRTAAFEHAARKELSIDTFTYPPPSIRPASVDEDRYVVHYTEPIARNRNAVWFDLGTDARRRAAIERARDSGSLTAIGRIPLTPLAETTPGLIFYMPVYRNRITPESVQERREHFIGVVQLVIRVEEMLHQLFGGNLFADLDVEIYENQFDETGGDPEPEDLVFDSGQRIGVPYLHANNLAFSIKRQFAVNIDGTRWQLHVTALPNKASSAQQWLPALATLAVMFLGALLFRVVRGLEFFSDSMQKRARSVEDALRTKETQLERIAASIDAALWRLEMPSRKLTYASPAVERLRGEPVEQILNAPYLWIRNVHPADHDRVRVATERIVESGDATFEYRVIRPDEQVRWIRCEAHYVPGENPGEGFIDGLSQDVTEQRRLEESLRRSNRALRAIHECDEAIANPGDENTLLQAICDAVVNAGYKMAWAGEISHEPAMRLTVRAKAGDHLEYIECIRPLLESGAMDQLPSILRAFETRHPCVALAADVGAGPVYLREEAVRLGLKSKIALPLVHNGMAIGILNVYAGEPNAFDDDALTLLTGMAQTLATSLGAAHDRTERQAAEAIARLHQRALEASANAIIITSASPPEYPIEYVNSAFERMTGYGAQEVIGRNLRFLHGEERDQPGLEVIRGLLSEKKEGQAVLRNYRKDGTPFWSDVYIAPVRDEDGHTTHFVATKYDITATKQYESELQYHSSFDTLTGLANRNSLQDRLRHAIAFAARDNNPLWLVLLNLDRFQIVNETLGFASGDLYLREVANRLKATLRATDTIARLSGDEFAIVLPEHHDGVTASAAITRLMDEVCRPLTIDGNEFLLACSVGVSAYPADGDDPETLLKHAHIAMYRAKGDRGTRFRFYASFMNEQIVERTRMETDLRNALERGEFELHYQPQVELRTGKIIGMEALIRWNHPQAGMIPPGRFIGLAEETGLIVPIGKWVLRSACEQAKEWQDAGLGQLRVAINLSAHQFAQDDLPRNVADILDETGLPARYLDLELTESVVMADVKRAEEILVDLKKLGVHLSIDDFGTGYSSLSYLKRFPIDQLKIDRSFITDLVEDPDDAAIVNSMISLAHSLHLHVIAEGVETEAQLAYLRRRQCDQIQGHVFSMALPACDFEEILRTGLTLPSSIEYDIVDRQTLLLIDDEVSVTAALHRLLRRDGYHILRASSAEEGFELLAKYSVQVILCDQRMPSMSGTEFLGKVKDMYPDTIRIVLSGYTDLKSVIDAINKGAIYRFFTKPWDDDVLRMSILDAFRHYWLLHAAEADLNRCLDDGAVSDETAPLLNGRRKPINA